jgi:O-antigen/teichoic acid export membrane protein
VWAIADQGLFALANFLTNVLLARWMPEAAYGVYTQVYLVFLLIGTAHTAVMTEPMLVFGAGRYREELPGYLAALLRGHWLLTGVASAITAAAAATLLARGHQMLGLTALALALAGPFILLQWLGRRACYISPGPRLAALAGAGYLVLSLGGAYGLYRARLLSPELAIGTMGVASLVSAGWILARLGVTGRSRGATPDRRDIAARHWSYGRWALASGALSWVPGSIYYLAFPATARGLADTATLRALMNLTLPATHVYAALATVLIPRLVPLVATADFLRTVRATLLRYVLAAVLYYLAIGAAGAGIVRLLYQERYLQSSGLLWVLGAVPAGVAVSTVLGAALRAESHPDRVFWAYGWASAAAVVVGVPLTMRFGLQGAAAAMVLTSVVTAGALGWAFFRTARPATAA